MRVWIIRKRTLLLLTAAVIIAVLAIIVGILFFQERGETPALMSSGASVEEHYELNVLPGKQRELPVYSVDRQDKRIALTIDAAWEDDKTDFILKTLDRYGVKATFFLCGIWVKTYPEDVKDIAKAGHEIGNHSKTHPHMNQLSAAQVQEEIRILDDEIEQLTGKRCTLFRAPYGEYNDTVIKAVREIGYEPIQWNLDTVDWKKERSTQTILDSVLPKLAPGAIILCHNNGFEIENYLPTLIETAQKEGYEFVTVSELLLSGDTAIDANGVQRLKTGG